MDGTNAAGRARARFLPRAAWLVCCALLLSALLAGARAESPVVISELCSSNKTLWLDSFGNYADYVELYNPGEDAVSLAGCVLSDGEDRHTLGADCVVPARGYLLLSLSGRRVAGDTSHVSFKLSSGMAATLTLTGADGALLDKVTMPPLPADCAFSRQAAGFAVVPGTPGAQNAVGEALDTAALENPVTVQPPRFSRASGFYDEAFSLEITAQSGCRVYYTLDCSAPGLASALYAGAPIPVRDISAQADVFAAVTDISINKTYTPPAAPVDKALVVRAVAVDALGNQSRVSTGVYFVGYQKKAGYAGVAVASLVIDPEDLCGAEKGIYVTGQMYADYLAALSQGGQAAGELTDTPANFMMSGRAWERESAFAFFNEGHELCLEQIVGARIHGNYSRDQLQKSFNLYARKEYGGGKFRYRFFNGYSLDTLMLRAARNTDEYLRDELTQAFLDGSAVGIQHAKPCLLFLNGEFWGVYAVREKQNARYIAQAYDVEEDNVVLIKNARLDEGTVFGKDAYRALLAFVREHDFNNAQDYAALGDLIDMQSYLDYVCAEIFCGNTDWPNNNEILWRTLPAAGAGYDDGRWRWLVFDLDQSMGYAANPPTLDSLKNARRDAMFAKLWESALFRADFCARFTDMANSILHPDVVLKALSALDGFLSPLMNRQKARFNAGFSEKQRASTVADYRAFAQGRYAALAALIAPGRAVRALTLAESLPGAGVWQLNGYAPAPQGGAWRGWELDGREVSVSVAAAEGYAFLGWELDGAAYAGAEAGAITLAMDGDHTLLARFLALPETRAAEDIAPAGGATVALDGAGGCAITAQDWRAGDGVTLSLNTEGLQNIEVSFALSGDKKAPRDWALDYSAEGGAFTPVAGAAWALAPGEETRVRVSLPEACFDCLDVRLRLRVTSGYCVNGKYKLYGSAAGEATLDAVTLRAARAERTLAAYRASLRAAREMAALYPALGAYLDAHPLAADAAQFAINSAARALDQARYDALRAANTQTLSAFAAGRDVSAQIALSLCADAPVYTVTAEMAAFGEPMATPAPYADGAYLYALGADGRFAPCGTLRQFTRDTVYLPTAEGVYLALALPMESYRVESAAFAPALLTQAQAESWFSGFPPEDVLLLTLRAVADFTGDCALQTDAWQGGAVVYCYRAAGDGLAFVCEGAYAQGEMRLTGLTDGEYILASRSVEECAALAARRRQGAGGR